MTKREAALPSEETMMKTKKTEKDTKAAASRLRRLRASTVALDDAIGATRKKLDEIGRKQRGCRCHEDIDVLLAGRGDQLALPISLKGVPVRVIVRTHKKDFPDRRSGSVLLASFCPFCGKAYG